MQKAICKVLILPIKRLADDQSEMVSQMLYGESCELIEQDGLWAKIKMDFDETIGWVLLTGLMEVEEIKTKNIVEKPFEYLESENKIYSIGSEVDFPTQKIVDVNNVRKSIVDIAKKFLSVPYLYGGRSFFGIDQSAFVQLIFKIHGINLPRFAKDQSVFGEVLDFIEESQPGDLAFFDDCDGNINHVGIMLDNFEILHCFGEVRKDSIDHSGIFNCEQNKHTHKLRFVKRII